MKNFSRRSGRRGVSALFLGLVLLAVGCQAPAEEAESTQDVAAPDERPPNVVIIFTDDQGYADSEHRPDGVGGNHVHELLRGVARLLAVAGGAADRFVSPAGLRPARLVPAVRRGAAPGRGHDRRPAQAARLRHGHLRQVALGPPCRAPARGAGVRRVLRPALLERHDAGSGEEPESPGTASPAAAARRGGRDDRDRAGPVAAHAPLHRARGRFHRAPRRSAVLSLPAPLDATPAAVRV